LLEDEVASWCLEAIEPIPFIGDGSYSWQGCQLESYDNAIA